MGFARIVCAPGHQGEPDLKSPECRKERSGATRRFLIMMEQITCASISGPASSARSRWWIWC